MLGLRPSSRSRIVGVAATTVAAALGVLATSSPASAADYGPDTCLQGYVWREATTGDRVCVLPSVRDQVRYDNNVAAARRNPVGAYGPDTCISGYVWREATSSDHVCVTTAARTQTRNDNAAAASRRNSVNIYMFTYSPPRKCDYSGPEPACSSSSVDSIPRFRVKSDGINVGTATVVLRRHSDNRLLRSWRVSAPRRSGAPGGAFTLSTDVFDCRKSTGDSYFQVIDPVSKRTSRKFYVSSQCSVL